MIIQLHAQPEPNGDENLSRLVDLTTQTCLVALDKMISCIRRAPVSYEIATIRAANLAERIVRASHEVGMTLPPEWRAK